MLDRNRVDRLLREVLVDAGEKRSGHAQFTRSPSRAYSTAATFASWITAAFVAQYGAACDHG